MLNTTSWNRLRYSAYAPLYDALVAPALRRPRRVALSQVDWEPGMRVLLVGAGTGLDLPFLPHELEIHLTDLTPAMVRRASARAERSPAPKTGPIPALASLIATWLKARTLAKTTIPTAPARSICCLRSMPSWTPGRGQGQSTADAPPVRGGEVLSQSPEGDHRLRGERTWV